MLVDVPRLVTAYYGEKPDPAIAAERIAFGTSRSPGLVARSQFQRSPYPRDQSSESATIGACAAFMDRCFLESTLTHFPSPRE